MSSTDTRPYTGTLIKDLSATVDRICARHADQDPMDFVLIRARQCPEIFLADAMTYLADRTMSGSDVLAWYLLRDIQDCFWAGKTEVCIRRTCRQLQGMHSPGNSYAPASDSSQQR